MYWTEEGIATVRRANLDGTGVEDLVTGRRREPGGIALDVAAGKMYWTDGGSRRDLAGRPGRLQRRDHHVRQRRPGGSRAGCRCRQGVLGRHHAENIRWADLDGSNVEDIIDGGLSDTKSIALDVATGSIYWINFGMPTIQRADLDGSNVGSLVEEFRGYGVYPQDIALDAEAGKMYWVEEIEMGSIKRANLDGSGIEELLSGDGLSETECIALDAAAGRLYWIQDGNTRIRRADLDGSDARDIVVNGEGGLQCIALDTQGEKIYWHDSAARSIRRANLDGSGVEDLVTRGVGSPARMAVDGGSGRVYWTDWGQ